MFNISKKYNKKYFFFKKYIGVSNIFIVLSTELEANYLPSGENWTLQTGSLPCSSIFAIYIPDFIFHIFIDPSFELDTK